MSPLHLTTVMESFHKAVFRSLKNGFCKMEGRRKALHNHCAPASANFLCFQTIALYESLFAKETQSSFVSYGIHRFGPDTFSAHSATQRIQPDAHEVTACASVLCRPNSLLFSSCSPVIR